MQQSNPELVEQLRRQMGGGILSFFVNIIPRELKYRFYSLEFDFRRWRPLPPSSWQPTPVTGLLTLASCVRFCRNRVSAPSYVAPFWFLDSPRKIALLCHCFPPTLMKYIPARTTKFPCSCSLFNLRRPYPSLRHPACICKF